jgi:sphinganine-1-phosphate aldolase
MSVDVHKYGYASKGVSVVAFRNPALRRASYVPSVDGCEGLYVTPTLQGSRSGATVAQVSCAPTPLRKPRPSRAV